MSFRTAAIVAVSAFLATANAHIIMEAPVPYSVDTIDSSPITAEGYPCKAQNGFKVSKTNAMAVGESQQVSFKGTAVHGGGSCQLSYTQDTEPTKDSVFKVIKSIEGGCPGVDGVKSFDYTLPDSIPNGKGTFAWTWFAKLSGAPEMYMNCAPIEVTGGASDASGLDALPDMLVANIADTTCKSPLNKALKFPDPGSEVQDMGTNDLEAPTGECGKTGSSPPSGGAPSNGTSPSTPSSKPSSGAPSGPSETDEPASGSGPSDEEPAAGTGPSETEIPSGPKPTGAPDAVPTTMATKTSAPIGTGAPAAPPVGTGAPSSGAPSSGAPSSGSPSAGGKSCSENGAIVCDGPEKFGLCNNGEVVFQAVAPGTTCDAGNIKKRGYNGRIARPRAI